MIWLHRQALRKVPQDDVRDRSDHDHCTIGAAPEQNGPGAMANLARIAGRRRSALCTVDLAPTTLAWLSPGSGWRRSLEVARSNPLGAGIRGRSTLRLGLRLDWSWSSCAYRSPAALSGGGLLSLRAQSDVRGFRRRMDWAMDRLRTSQPQADCNR